MKSQLIIICLISTIVSCSLIKYRPKIKQVESIKIHLHSDRNNSNDRLHSDKTSIEKLIKLLRHNKSNIGVFKVGVTYTIEINYLNKPSDSLSISGFYIKTKNGTYKSSYNLEDSISKQFYTTYKDSL